MREAKELILQKNIIKRNVKWYPYLLNNFKSTIKDI